METLNLSTGPLFRHYLQNFIPLRRLWSLTRGMLLTFTARIMKSWFTKSLSMRSELTDVQNHHQQNHLRTLRGLSISDTGLCLGTAPGILRESLSIIQSSQNQADAHLLSDLPARNTGDHVLSAHRFRLQSRRYGDGSLVWLCQILRHSTVPRRLGCQRRPRADENRKEKSCRRAANDDATRAPRFWWLMLLRCLGLFWTLSCIVWLQMISLSTRLVI